MLEAYEIPKKSVGSIVLIIGLLFLQAYCDLSLPDYTSKIINVGIQQKGIEDGVPEKIRESSLENLQLFMSRRIKRKFRMPISRKMGFTFSMTIYTKEEGKT